MHQDDCCTVGYNRINRKLSLLDLSLDIGVITIPIHMLPRQHILRRRTLEHLDGTACIESAGSNNHLNLRQSVPCTSREVCGIETDRMKDKTSGTGHESDRTLRGAVVRTEGY